MYDRCLRFLLVSLICLACLHPAQGQTFPMLHYTMDDGLPSNTVYDVYRDSKGYLWFATDKGIAKYNGIKFETFTTFNGLSDNEVFFVKEDHYGRLWIATYNGELCYYKDGVFHSAANTPFLKLPFKVPFIDNIFLENDSSVTLHFFTKSVFANVTKDEARMYKVDLDNSQKIHYIDFLKKRPDGGFDVYTTGRLIQLDMNGKTVKTTPIPETYLKYSFNQNQRYSFDDDNIYSESGKIIKKLKGGFFKSYYWDSLHKLNRIYIGDGNDFLATNRGVFINDSMSILKNDRASSVTQDIKQNYWVSTLNDGVYYFNKDFLYERSYDSVYTGKINFVCGMKGRLFFANSENNLYVLENGKSKCLFNYASYRQSENKIFNMPGYLIDSDYSYYNYFDGDHFFVKNILAPGKEVNQFKNVFIYGVQQMFFLNGSIYLEDNSKLRLGKLDYKNIRTGEDISRKVVPITDEFKNSERIFCIAKSRENILWYSTINHVYKVVNDVPVIQSQFKNITFKSFDFIGDCLVGYTHNNQLLVCRGYDKQLQVDSIKPQNCIWENFYKMDVKHILIKTNNLYRLLTLGSESDPKKDIICAIENPFIPLRAEAICSDGNRCYFFKNGSITSIDIENLLQKPAAPKIFFTSLKTRDRSYPIESEMEFSFRDSRNITISFSTLSFTGKNILYQYSVSKNDQDNWRDITDQINLVNTGYGIYTIKLRAKTISSDYCEPVVFSLHILRPYWATWWFIALCVFMALVIAGVAIRIRVVSLLRKKEREHKTEIKFMKSEYKALNALMNPHFIFNTLNNVQSLVNDNNKLAANEYLRVFADLIRQNMHNISKELIPLQKEIDLVNNYLLLEKLRFEDKLSYSINIDEDIDLSDIQVPPLLIQPLVENSIKHGILPMKSGAGQVNLDIYERQNVLFIEVRDNGVGLVDTGKYKSDTMHESFGIENIKKRIQQLSIIQNKHISFNIAETKDENGQQWTTVTITMPIT